MCIFAFFWNVLYITLYLLSHESWWSCSGELSLDNCYPRSWASLVAQTVKNPPAMQETWVWTLGREYPREKRTSHFSILAWRIPWTKEPGRLQSTGLQRVGHDWSNWACVNIWPINFRQKKSAMNFGESFFFSHTGTFDINCLVFSSYCLEPAYDFWSCSRHFITMSKG